MSYYLIDGYNLFFQSKNKKHPLETSRVEFIEFLGKTMTTLGLKGTVVFDSHPAHSAVHPIRSEKGHLEVIVSPTNIDADTFLIEFLASQPNVKNITLVTSDNEVASAAKPHGVSILSVKEFLKLLHDKELRSTRINEKPNLECRFELQRLLEIFEKRYRSNTSE